MIPLNSKKGRPSLGVSGEAVRALRGAGLSWREIARRMGVGCGTARRAFLSVPKVPFRLSGSVSPSESGALTL